ncbi:MAG: polysaccharide deacetylase family protein [Bacteroidales bacterium]
MKGRLSESQKQYVLDHLAHHAALGPEVLSKLHFGENKEDGEPGVFFLLSDESYDRSRVLWINKIPVLFPVSDSVYNFYRITNGSVYFEHDLLKSAFYLLSGYDQYEKQKEDAYGRFPYRDSIQCELDIARKPMVNYYFEILLQGIGEFCRINGLALEWNHPLDGPVLMLSHDIDRIDAYHVYEVAYTFKQLAGLEKSPLSRSDRWTESFTGLAHLANPFSRKNPFWTFDYLRETEARRNIHSTYFFLEKDGAHANSRYRFHEKRMMALFRDLDRDGHEIGLHGTIRSATEEAALKETLNHLSAASPQPVHGIRQHYLKFKPGLTASLHAEAGLRYDATLGFSEQEGFRNSYCWPFKIYDHEKDRSHELWEIPLTVMESTLFYYRTLSLADAMEAMDQLMEETCRFQGVFSLLWHNHFFPEKELPGITRFYEKVLDLSQAKGMKGLTGRTIIEAFS